ncbi:hypothetical protein [Flavobacterium sp. UBA6046]|uniref:pPIWI-associating nuclease domain-containing protein n=1 Tax=Flavobacterium sp. UBA6046 TaxID=1946552 RepID=UPI0025C4CA55|nr:hypothetical protein [Flavobacterium sp. UBA6046]
MEEEDLKGKTIEKILIEPETPGLAFFKAASLGDISPVQTYMGENKIYTSAGWNANSILNPDGTVRLTGINLHPPSVTPINSLSLGDFNGDEQLLTFVNHSIAVTGVSRTLSEGFATTSSLYPGYTNLLEQQDRFLIQTPQLNGLLGTNTSAFVTNVISPLTGSIAEIGLASVNTGRLYETGALTVNNYKLAETVSSLCIESVKVAQSALTGMIGQISDTTFNTGQIASNYFISNGANAMLQALPSYPTQASIPHLRIVEREIRQTEKAISEHQKKLDILLSKIDSELVEFRLACWEAFNKKGNDYVGQASSSMRRLVDKLFRVIAPAAEVEKTKYFQNSPKAKDSNGKPTREARVRYVANHDENKANHIERLTKSFIETWNHLSAWDHEPIDEDGFVYGVLISIEGHLISLLSVNK